LRLLMSLFFSMLLLVLNPGLLMAADDEIMTAGSGDSKIHWAVFPIIYSTPETGFALGGNFMALHKSNPASPEGKQDIFQGMLIYTEKEQIICNLDLKKYYHNDRLLLMVQGGYVDFPSKFYGIGPDADEDWEENYTLIQKAYIGSLLWKLTPQIYLGPLVAYGQFDIEDRKAGGLLDAGNINGYDGTTVTGYGFQFLLDTRDDEFMPHNGSVLNVLVSNYSKDLGSDEDFSQLGVIYKQFWPVGQDKIFAFMGTVTLSDGTVPFEMMPCLGGATIMRGYYSGFNRDRNYAAIQGEYRFPISARFSGVTFAGLGEVAPDIDRFDAENVKAAGGFGIRFLLYPKQKVKLRLDVGFSETGTNTYIYFMEAF
jgi:hypothetical protein